MGWWTYNKFRTFGDLKAYVDGARFPEKGRRPYRWCHVRREGENIHISVHDHRIATVTPDGVLTFVADTLTIRYVQPSLSANMHKILPIWWARAGKCKWRVAQLDKTWITLPERTHGHDYYYFNWWKARKEAPMYYKGLQFNMHSMSWVNAKPDPVHTIDKERRKWWLAATRRFRKDIAVRVKIGVFDTYEWEREQRELPMETVATCLTTDKYPPELLRLIHTEASNWRNGGKPSHEELNEAAKRLIKNNSFDLRVKLGVITSTETL